MFVREKRNQSGNVSVQIIDKANGYQVFITIGSAVDPDLARLANSQIRTLGPELIFGKESKRGFGTTKQPVFGILCRNGKVFAKLVDDTQAKDLIPIITKRVKPGTRICSDTYHSYTGLAAGGYVHRTVEHGTKEYVRGKNHINGLEGFWGYLKRKLSAKGGVGRKYLGLFLGEYVWRYNHRNLDIKQQTKRIIGLLKSSG